MTNSPASPFKAMSSICMHDTCGETLHRVPSPRRDALKKMVCGLIHNSPALPLP